MITIGRHVLIPVLLLSSLSAAQESRQEAVDVPVAESMSPGARAEPVIVKVVELPAPPPQQTSLSLDSLKSGKLIEYGFSIGAGYAVHVPLRGLTDYGAKDVTASFMPYVVAYPLLFLLKSGPETRAYCAAIWSLSSREVAVARADQLARTRTQRELEQEDVSGAEILRETGWRLGGDAVCQHRLIGLYLGKPSSISPTILPDTNLADATPK